MSNNRLYYKELLASFINDNLDEDRIRILYNFINSNPQGYEQLMNDPDIVALAESRSLAFQSSLTEETNQKLRQRILAHINDEARSNSALLLPIGNNNDKRRRDRIWYLVAASFILLVGLGIYFNILSEKDRPSLVVDASEKILAPSSSLAMITLSDGSKILLDSLQNGHQALLSNMKIMKNAAGQITYEVLNGSNPNALSYNTLTNPRGSEVVNILLADGTRVWLNAGSTLKYPVSFVGNERVVEIKGEGYFEVAKDPKKKFIVKTDKVQTEVLGTHFNVNSFEDETTKVTLLEGSIKVNAELISQAKVLKPGEQAEVGNRLTLNAVDVQNVMAWKEGYFSLDGLPFPEFMKQLERWYDIEVIYMNGNPDIQLFGKLGRDLNLQEIVSSLMDMGVDCKIQGRKLYIE